MKLSRRVGATSQIFQIFIRDSSSSTGAGLAGLTNASSGLTAYYHRDTDTTATAISLVTMTVGTFTSSGFKEIDSTNMPGVYQFCPPNAALASGAASVIFHLKGATNMAPLPIEVDLDSQVDVYFWNGTVVATPATAGIPDINVKNMNNVAATSITTINANVGTTQPENFTGTGASALVKTDVTDIATVAVSATTAQLGVNVVNWNNTVVATPATAGIPDVNAKNINNVATTSVTTINANLGTTQPTNFTGTAASALVKSDMVDVAGSAVSTSTAQLGVNVVNWNGTVVGIPATAGIPDINVKNIANAAVSTSTAQVGVNVVNIAGQAAALDANNLLKVDTEDWKGGVIPAVNVTGVPKIDLVDWLGTAPLALSAQQVQAVVPSSTIVASVTGAVGSVTGAVGSVTGNVGGNVVGSVASVTAPVLIAANQLFVKKNTAFTLTFPMTDSTTHAPKTGLTVTSKRTIDGAALATTANSVTELADGLYNLSVAGSDLNGTMITFEFTAAAADTKFLGVVTQA